MYLILCAMKEEVSEIIEKLDIAEKYSFFGMEFFRGAFSMPAGLRSREAVVGMTGVGKVMAAMNTQKLIDVFSPQKIIFAGIAGGVSDNIDVGDIVVSTDTIQYDMDASALGFKIGEIPFTGIRTIEADPEMVSAAKSFKAENCKITLGRILTADRFVSTSNPKERDFLTKEMAGIAVEMEGAAAALVAKMNNIPFVVIRVISDKCDGKAPKDFNKFLKKSSKLIVDMVLHIVKFF